MMLTVYIMFGISINSILLWCGYPITDRKILGRQADKILQTYPP